MGKLGFHKQPRTRADAYISATRKHMHLCAVRDQPTAFFVMEHSRPLSETLPQEDHIRRQNFVIDRILLDCVLLQMFLIAVPFLP
jgi:hypothetical protein